MAWQARVRDAIAKPISDTVIQVVIEYFDDADSATVLHVATFEFDAGVKPAQMQAQIIQLGQLARSAFAQAASLTTGRPPGTVLFAIP